MTAFVICVGSSLLSKTADVTQSICHHKLLIRLISLHIKIIYIYTIIFTVTIPSHTYNTIDITVDL